MCIRDRNLSSQVHHCVNLNDMLPLCDYITIHVPYLPTTKDLSLIHI